MTRQGRHFQSRSAAIDFADDVIRGFGPDERLRIGIVVFDVIVDGAFQFRHAGKYPSADPLCGDLSEPALNQVQPR